MPDNSGLNLFIPIWMDEKLIISITTHVVRGIPLSSNGFLKTFWRFLLYSTEISCLLCQIVAWCVWLGREFIECVRHGESYFSRKAQTSGELGRILWLPTFH
jgi:hypothetical protein